jgi:cytochrome P450
MVNYVRVTLQAVFGTDDYFRYPDGDLHDLREADPTHHLALPGYPSLDLPARYRQGQEAGSWSRGAPGRRTQIIERHTDDLLAAMRPGPGEIDLAGHFARPLSLRVLAGVSGIPQSEVPALQDLLDTAIGGATPASRAARPGPATAVWAELAEQHAGEDTMLGMLGRARQDREITAVELTSLLTMLMVADAHAMSMFLTRAVLLLSAPPSPAWAGSPDSAYSTGVELTAMLAGSDRAAQEAAAGELLWLLPFGHRAPYCLDPALAELQARIALVRLYQRFPRLSVTGEATWRNYVVPEPTSLPVRLADLTRG